MGEQGELAIIQVLGVFLLQSIPTGLQKRAGSRRALSGRLRYWVGGPGSPVSGVHYQLRKLGYRKKSVTSRESSSSRLPPARRILSRYCLPRAGSSGSALNTVAAQVQSASCSVWSGIALLTIHIRCEDQGVGVSEAQLEIH